MKNDQSRHRVISTTLLLFLGVFSIYLLTMPLVIQNNEDALEETSRALADSIVFRPNHLLLSHVYHLWIRLMSPIFHGLRPFVVLQILTSLCGALTSVMIFSTMVRVLKCPLRNSLAATVFLSFTFCHWGHSRESETEALGMMLIFMSIYFLCRALLDEKIFARQRLVFTAICSLLFSAAILCSFNFVLFFPGICISIWAFRNNTKTSFGLLSTFASISVIVTFSIYYTIYSFTFAARDIASFLGWLLNHPEHNQGFLFNGLGIGCLFRAVSGVANYFTGFSSLTTCVKRWFSGGAVPDIAVMDVLRFIVGNLLLAAFTTTSFLFSYKFRRGVSRETFSLAALTIPTVVFNTLWLGSDPQFWMVVTPLVFIYITFLFKNTSTLWQRRAAGLLYASTAVLFVFNLGIEVPTMLDGGGGSNWKTAHMFSKDYCDSCVVVSASKWTEYLRSNSTEIETKDIYYGIEAANFDEYYRNFKEIVDRGLSHGKEVYLIEVLNVKSQFAFNLWDGLASRSGVFASDLSKRIFEEYEISTLDDAALKGTVARISCKTPPSESYSGM